MTLRIAVGIPTAGRAAILLETLRELSRQTCRPDRVIVCAATEEDVRGVAEAAPEAEVLMARAGLTRQRNRILEAAADCDLLVFFDDDFLAAPAYLAVIELLFRLRPELVIATGAVIADGITGPGLSPEGARALLAADRYQSDMLAATPVANGYGCNMAVRLAPARQARIRFDERLPLYGWQEDVDFSYRLARHGAVVCAAGARGVHLGVKQGRSPGLQLGYSQIANPVYLVGKACGYPAMRAAGQIGRNLAANLARLARPEPWVDRRGRLRGNWLALIDLVSGRLDPERTLHFAGRAAAGLVAARAGGAPAGRISSSRQQGAE